MTTPAPSPPDHTRARGAFVLDVADRARGKTWRALDWVSRDPDHRMLVVANPVLREQAVVIARADWPDVRWNRSNVLTASQARAALGDRVLGLDSAIQVWVDDVDVVLRQLLHAPHVAGASCSAAFAGELQAEPAVEAP